MEKFQHQLRVKEFLKSNTSKRYKVLMVFYTWKQKDSPRPSKIKGSERAQLKSCFAVICILF